MLSQAVPSVGTDELSKVRSILHASVPPDWSKVIDAATEKSSGQTTRVKPIAVEGICIIDIGRLYTRRKYGERVVGSALSFLADEGQRLFDALQERDNEGSEPTIEQVESARMLLERLSGFIDDEMPTSKQAKLPLITVNVDEDGAILLEWQFKANRIDYCIDEDPDESCVFLVDGSDFDRAPKVVTFDLATTDIEAILRKSIEFAATSAD